MRKLLLFLAVLVLLGAPRGSGQSLPATGPCGDKAKGDSEAAGQRAALREADIAFARATAEKGVEGWVSYFAEDGSMLPAGAPIVTGKEAIRALMAPAFANPSFSLTWQPTKVEVSCAGDFGYTIGTFERKVNDAEGKPNLRRGKYVTIWKKDAASKWKVVVDIGNADESPAAAP